MIKKGQFLFPAFFIGLYLLWVLRATLFYSAVDASMPDEWAQLFFANLVKLVLWVIPAALYITRLDKKNPLEVMRMTTPLAGAGLRTATFITLLYFICVFTFEYLQGQRTLLPLFQATPSDILTVMLAVFVSPFPEEFLFRGFVLSKLQETQSFWSANVLQSVLFTAMHIPFWIWSGGFKAGLIFAILSLWVIGLLLGWITRRTNSIWPAIIVHILNNFLVSFLG